MVIAPSMLPGGSAACCHVSGLQLLAPKKRKYGSLSPLYMNVPVAPNMSSQEAQYWWASNPAPMIMDLLT